MKKRDNIRYGDAFKRQVVEEIESGKFAGATAAARAYGIKGAETVPRWLRRYGREDLLPKKIHISTMTELDENKALKQRVRELEKALADAYMKGLLEESYLEIACGQMGMEVERFKKKHVTKLSDKPRGKELR